MKVAIVSVYQSAATKSFRMTNTSFLRVGQVDQNSCSQQEQRTRQKVKNLQVQITTKSYSSIQNSSYEASEVFLLGT